MAMYESEHTRFMRAWMEKHPEELDVQKTGRALWWDKAPVSPEDQQRITATVVRQKPYYYDAN